MQALVLAGGLGTRLRSLVNDRPKSMAAIGDKPFLEYLIMDLVSQNVKDIVLCVGYMSEQILEYFGDGSKFGCHIKYSIENTLLGTGGAIKQGAEYISEDDFFVLNGDTFIKLDYAELFNFHIKNKPVITLALAEVLDSKRYGAVVLGDGNRIIDFKEKGGNSNSKYINAGVYVCNHYILQYIDKSRKVSIENETFPLMLQKEVKMLGYPLKDYFIDIGLPETYKKFQEDMERDVAYDYTCKGTT